MWDWLSGKKTYIAGAMLIVAGIIQRDLELILQGLTAMALRNGMTTEAAKMILKK